MALAFDAVISKTPKKKKSELLSDACSITLKELYLVDRKNLDEDDRKFVDNLFEQLLKVRSYKVIEEINEQTKVLFQLATSWRHEEIPFLKLKNINELLSGDNNKCNPKIEITKSGKILKIENKESKQGTIQNNDVIEINYMMFSGQPKKKSKDEKRAPKMSKKETFDVTKFKSDVRENMESKQDTIQNSDDIEIDYVMISGQTNKKEFKDEKIAPKLSTKETFDVTEFKSDIKPQELYKERTRKECREEKKSKYVEEKEALITRMKLLLHDSARLAEVSSKVTTANKHYEIFSGLGVDQMMTLRRGHWVDGELISRVLRMKCPSDDKIEVFDISFSAAMNANDNDDLGNILDPSFPKQGVTYIFPHVNVTANNTTGSHFSVIVLKFIQDGTIVRFIDSMGNGEKKSQKRFTRKILNFTASSGVVDAQTIPSPIQDDSSSCGYYTLINILEVYGHCKNKGIENLEEIVYIKERVKRMREYIIFWISQYLDL